VLISPRTKGSKFWPERPTADGDFLQAVWYGILEFNVPLEAVSNQKNLFHTWGFHTYPLSPHKY